MTNFTITVPASSSNIGPGFDVLGLTLSLHLTLTVTIHPSTSSPTVDTTHRHISLKYTGEGADGVPLTPEKNLITKTAFYVLESNGIPTFPAHTDIHVHNAIPLGRGLGSSGAAVVAGVMLANQVGNLNLTKDRMLDYCLTVERHPDNVTAALMGGFVASYLRELSPPERRASATSPRSETFELEENALAECVIDAAYAKREAPPDRIGHYVRLSWASEIKAIVIIPQFELSTAKARAALPDSYSRPDVVFNLQRLAVLTSALSSSPPNADLIYQAMQDKMHQPYRQHLIPGLPEVLSTVNPESAPGCLGVCLSGAGPTILALATGNFDDISNKISKILQTNGVKTVVMLLDMVQTGAECAIN